MRNAGLEETQAGIKIAGRNISKKHKLESRLLGEISVTSGMQMTPPFWQKVKRN